MLLAPNFTGRHKDPQGSSLQLMPDGCPYPIHLAVGCRSAAVEAAFRWSAALGPVPASCARLTQSEGARILPERSFLPHIRPDSAPTPHWATSLAGGYVVAASDEPGR